MRLLLLCFIFSISANATIVNGPSVTQGDGVNRFVDGNRVIQAGTGSCSQMGDIPSATLCLCSDEFMHKALDRANLWAEGWSTQFPQGRLYENDSDATQITARRTVGFDLKGRDLIAFYKAAQAACDKSPGNPKVCLTKEEKEFFAQVIIPKAVRDPNFVLITAGTKEGANVTKATVDHELYHARYFASKRYRDIVAENWRQLSDGDRKTMEAFLATRYDPNDTDLKVNEFQAMSLDTARFVHQAPIGAWSEKLRNDLYREGLLPSNANPYSNTSATITR